MGKVYGYGRLAFASNEEMAQQLKVIDDYCKGCGLKLDRVFYDNGASGLSLDRKGLNQLLRVLQSGDIVVIKDIARLSRSYSQCLALIEQIRNIGATLIIIH